MRISLALLATAVVVFVTVASAGAAEIQLAGVRLGQHAVNLLDIWDQPNGVVTGEGPETAPAASQMPPGGAPMMTQPGMGMEGMMGMPPGAMGPVGPMGPMGGPMGPVPGMEAMGGMGGFPGMGAPPGMMGPEMGMGPGMGMPGAEAGMGVPGAGVAGVAAAAPFPIWALPVWVTLESGEVEWIYQRGPVVMGFVLDRDGYITCIAVAGYECNYARTALWQPHRYVKLGDSLKRVLYRYGYPDEMESFTASGPGVGQNSITVSFGQTSRTYTRDCILRYMDNNNIAFTLHDFKVVRIHIWQR